MRLSLAWLALAALVLPACGSQEEAPRRAETSPPAAAPATAPAAAPEAPAELPQGLAVAISYFEKSDEGKPVPRSQHRSSEALGVDIRSMTLRHWLPKPESRLSDSASKPDGIGYYHPASLQLGSLS